MDVGFEHARKDLAARGMTMIVTSAPERDDLFGEIYHNEELWAFVERHRSGLHLKIVSHTIEVEWDLALDDAIAILELARQRLSPPVPNE